MPPIPKPASAAAASSQHSTFNGEGFLRLRDVIAPAGPLPIARSTFLAGVASGLYPRPVKLGPRIVAWSKADLRAFLARCEATT